ncbi:hypothetical protein B0H13DRAFT_1882397 [Mycena leptocephala]|nr:hypothetical protein B0H13DRAFT_1882397 [Mycena leptocephala]
MYVPGVDMFGFMYLRVTVPAGLNVTSLWRCSSGTKVVGRSVQRGSTYRADGLLGISLLSYEPDYTANVVTSAGAKIVLWANEIHYKSQCLPRPPRAKMNGLIDYVDTENKYLDDSVR